ncbi:MAG: L,D-transpeptidase family protein [Epsilonproteobacteria bacterium]|nr:L,D-transpeptidase family protein [Campylobacterota bacterium]
MIKRVFLFIFVVNLQAEYLSQTILTSIKSSESSSVVASSSVSSEANSSSKSEHLVDNAKNSSSSQNSSTSVIISKWFEGEEIRETLFKLIERVQTDETILCKSRFRKQVRKLSDLIENYSKNPTPTLRKRIESVANNLEFSYLKVVNSGCFNPAPFLRKDYIPCKSKDFTKKLHSPILDRLYKMLKFYKKLKLKGGWEKIEIKDILYLRPNEEYDEIPLIRKRLAQEGFYKGDDFNSTLFDENLTKSVMEFQKSHGLKPDGVIGPMTLAQMNISVEEKIGKILLNIERARWFLKDDPFFVFVDIPGFFLEVFDENRSVFKSDVIVGRRSRPTPQMRHEISYAVLNPYWRAPKTIIKEDILPQLKAGKFSKIRAKRIIASLDPYGRERVRFEDVDWNNFSADDLPFYFLQLPGPKNFLGFIKFMFPNRFDVYLHDTNSRRLFKYSYRALSSGCVRVKKPIELYHLLINRNRSEKIDYRDIFSRLWKNRTKKVYLKPKVPVYLLYLTTFMDEKGNYYFYPDIYGIDKKMEELVR